MKYCEVTKREVEYLALSRDTTEADLKQVKDHLLLLFLFFFLSFSSFCIDLLCWVLLSLILGFNFD